MAINLPPGQRRELFAATAPLRDCAPWVKWTAEDKLHLTVKFIGDQPAATAESIATSLAEVARGHDAMDLSAGGVGAFPNFRRPSVVWLGVEPHPRLELLHHDIELACARHGIEVEGRAFRPHLTLGRVARRPDAGALRRLAAVRKQVTFRTEIRVDSVDLMRSELLAEGARHTLVAAAPLRTE